MVHVSQASADARDVVSSTEPWLGLMRSRSSTVGEEGNEVACSRKICPRDLDADGWVEDCVRGYSAEIFDI
jgi:hypothetical protein